MKTSTIGTFAALIFALTASAGCAMHDELPVDKTEARSMPLSEWAEDYCLTNGWYEDGECDSFCPTSDDACGGEDPSACECGPAPAIGYVCDDGSAASTVCVDLDDGTCELQFDCGEMDLCSAEDCGPAPGAAPQCDDGSTGTYECQATPEGCGYVLSCGGSDGGTGGGDDGGADGCVDAHPTCEPEECGPAPAIARVCDDGDTADRVCHRSEDGECHWDHVCE
jgi:hypothetical protein